MEISEYGESKGDHTSLLHPYSVASAAKSIVMLGEQSHSGIECGGTISSNTPYPKELVVYEFNVL